MNKAIAALFTGLSVVALGAANAIAQDIKNPQHSGAAGAYNSSPPTCTAGQWCALQTDANGLLKTTASISASIAGFTAATLGTPFTASEAGATATLPAGAVVVAVNSGSVGTFCNLGGTPSQNGIFISGGGGWFAFTVGASTQLSCQTIPLSGNTTINMIGGTGIPTGTGGGGGSGGGGGVVTQGTSPWVDNITQWAGIAVGAMANYGTSPGAVKAPGVNAFVTDGAITANAGTNLNTSALALNTNVTTTNTDIGPPGATACATDTGSCSVNALLQRIAQRITSMIAATLAVADATLATDIGAPGATACATDTSSCSVNALLQRISQRLTTLIGAGAGAITTWGGGTLGAMANYGTSPGAVLVPGVNAFVTNQIGTGTAGTPNAAVVSVQGITSGTVLGVADADVLAAVQAPIPSGTNIVGKVGIDQTTPGTTNGVISGGTSVEVCAGLTTTNGTYAANTNVGGKITLASLFGAKGSGIIQSVRVDFKTVQTVEFDLYPFSADPSNSTWTDNSANAINAADVYKVEPPIVMATAKSGLGTHTVYYASGIGQPIAMGAANTSGYFILTPTATTATLAGTTGAQVCVTVLRDDP